MIRELDERVTSGLRVRLMLLTEEFGPQEPHTFIEVYEGLESTQPVLTYETAPERAREAFLHPYGCAP